MDPTDKKEHDEDSVDDNVEPTNNRECDEHSEDDNLEPTDKKERYEDSGDNNDNTEMHNKEVKRYASFCMQMKSMNK